MYGAKSLTRPPCAMSSPSSLDRLKNALTGLKAGAATAPAAKSRAASPLIDGHELTGEQQAALGSGSRRIKIQAFAGTGKTTLLRAFAQQARTAKGLYLAFNTSIARHGQSVFPEHVQCRTHNSTALRELGKRNPGWARCPDGKLDNLQTKHLASLSGHEGLRLSLILDTINRFIYSLSPELSTRHFPHVEAMILSNSVDGFDMDLHVGFARHVWARMCDPYSDIPMPHDGYLKLWSLNPSQLACDYVMVDESQDSNPAFLQALEQQRCRIIYVGDEHQGIYGFRGAINALRNVVDCDAYQLTETHRFGPAISLLANDIIAAKGSAAVLRSSLSAPDTQTIHGRAPLGCAPLYLSRSNAGLFEQALSLAKQGKFFSMIGGSGKFSFPDLSDLLALSHQSGKGLYQAYRDLDELEQTAEKHGQGDLAMRARLVRQHADAIPSMLEAINSKIVPRDQSSQQGTPKLSTLHQAKGLESDWVELLPDFSFTPQDLVPIPGADEATRLAPNALEEANVLYVAITRAKLGLAIRSGSVGKWATPIIQKHLAMRVKQTEKDEDLFG